MSTEYDDAWLTDAALENLVVPFGGVVWAYDELSGAAADEAERQNSARVERDRAKAQHVAAANAAANQRRSDLEARAAERAAERAAATAAAREAERQARDTAARTTTSSATRAGASSASVRSAMSSPTQGSGGNNLLWIGGSTVLALALIGGAYYYRTHRMRP